MPTDRRPHIGEYDTKTNANGDLSQISITFEIGRKIGRSRLQPPLLPVIHQNLIAGRGELGAVLLQAGQNGQVTLVHDGSTIFLNIVGAGLLFLRRAASLLLWLGNGPGGQRQQREYQD